MQIRNISGAARFIVDAAHDFTTGDIEPGDTVDVDDEVGASLCEQVDVWESTGVKGEGPKDRKAREKAEALAAFVADEAAQAGSEKS